jgi:hypothetical protein
MALSDIEAEALAAGVQEPRGILDRTHAALMGKLINCG